MTFLTSFLKSDEGMRWGGRLYSQRILSKEGFFEGKEGFSQERMGNDGDGNVGACEAFDERVFDFFWEKEKPVC